MKRIVWSDREITLSKSVWILETDGDSYAFLSKQTAIEFAQNYIMNHYSHEVSIHDWKNIFTLTKVTLYE